MNNTVKLIVLILFHYFIYNKFCFVNEEVKSCGVVLWINIVCRTVAQWLAVLPHSAREPGLIPSWVTVCVEFAHSPPVSAWVSSGCSGFLPQSQRCAS